MLFRSREDKIGFATPEFQWLKTLNKDFETLLPVSKKIQFINIPMTKKQITQTLESKRTFTWQVWRLINFLKLYACQSS